MINLGDELILKIEKLTPQGVGLSRYGEEKFVVFVEGVLIDETVKAKITKLNKKYANAQLIEVILESPHRKKPICALYNACGSCDNQICDYEYSCFLKTEILKDIFKDLIPKDKIYDVIESPKTLEYRHKIQYPAQQTKNSKRIMLGYYKNNSHELTNIKFCPIQPDVANKIAQYIRDNFPFDCYREKTHKGLLRNILIRLTSDNQNALLTFVLNCKKDEFEKFYKTKLSSFSSGVMSKFKEIKGVFANLNNQKTNKILSEQDVKISGQDYIIETLDNKKYQIGPSSFFQVNPHSAIQLFDVVKNQIKNNSTILDAYGGVGAIGIWASKKASKIILVEENKNAVSMAKENYKLNNIDNYEIYEGDASIHLNNFLKENRNFDYVILDPPRQGCSSDTLKTMSKLAKNIIYVSCNPITLKRDMEQLILDKFSPKFIQGVDLFPYTHHIEAVVLFEKEE